MEKNEREKIDNFILLSHDLKTNLTASKWLIGMIENGDFGPVTDSQRDALQKVRDANERMLSSINETMFMFRSGITDQVYRFTPCDLHLIITSTLAQLQGELTKKHILIEYTPPREMLVIEADVEKMRIVFQNIIDNAVKYGNTDSTITIILRSDETHIHCSISNYGIGIPDSEKEHIFEQYFRASNSKAHESGTGIGLFGTKQIIEKHAGTITFESELDGKTTFTITLPKDQI